MREVCVDEDSWQWFHVLLILMYLYGLGQPDLRSLPYPVLKLYHSISYQLHSFASPFNTSSNNVNAAAAKPTIFFSRSPPYPVSTSLVYVPTGEATASATSPLQQKKMNKPKTPYYQTSRKMNWMCTYGVLFAGPPDGPAVPLSETVYVDCSFDRVCSARPATTAGVGPL
jgi:hypothetical protein